MENKRSHLEGLINRYFEALVAHDPSLLPLAKNCKFTENTITLQPGVGLWATAGSLPTYKHAFVDPKEGQAGCFAVLLEHDSPVLLALRLKEENEQITEIETIVVRPQEGDPQEFVKLERPDPIFAEVLPPDERPTREDLIRHSDSYFDGLEQDTADFVKFDDDCYRMENGMITANNKAANIDANDAIAVSSTMKCAEQFEKKVFYFISRVRPRRHWLFDEERGLIVTNAVIVHDGVVLGSEIPGFGKVETPLFAKRPSSVVVMELFKIKNDKIRAIEVVGTTFPYGIGTGWE